MEKYKITYQGKGVEIERLPNGKFKIPSLGQFTKQGLGSTWLDDCRIPYQSNYDEKHQSDIQRGQGNADRGRFFGGNGRSLSSGNLSGRFPANLLVSDDVLNTGIDSKSGKDAVRRQEGMFVDHHLGGVGSLQVYHPDSGSFSRYFDLDKWAKTFPFLIVPKASKSEKNKGLDNNITVKYNIDGGILCKDEVMVAVQLLQRVTSGLTVQWSNEESGESITVQFHRDSSSTILTEISRIIELKILPSLMHSLTSGYTQDASGSMENGGSLAEGVERLREYLLTITDGKLELARGVSRVALEMLLKISERENWHENYNIHSTVKPLKLMSYLITLGSREGDTVLDPFGGSGTTALASKLLSRKCIISEIEEKYCEIAAKRCSQEVFDLR